MTVERALIARWIGRFGLHIALDTDGFLCVSRNAYFARGVLALDRSVGKHTFELGIRLGYPFCCCRRAAEVGDEGLDELAAALSQQFHGRFKLIDPSGYPDGRAFISHVPCSARCKHSLRMASALQNRQAAADLC